MQRTSAFSPSRSSSRQSFYRRNAPLWDDDDEFVELIQHRLTVLASLTRSPSISPASSLERSNRRRTSFFPSLSSSASQASSTLSSPPPSVVQSPSRSPELAPISASSVSSGTFNFLSSLGFGSSSNQGSTLEPMGSSAESSPQISRESSPVNGYDSFRSSHSRTSSSSTMSSLDPHIVSPIPIGLPGSSRRISQMSTHSASFSIPSSPYTSGLTPPSRLAGSSLATDSRAMAYYRPPSVPFIPVYPPCRTEVVALIRQALIYFETGDYVMSSQTFFRATGCSANGQNHKGCDPLACYAFGICLLNGYGVDINYPMAINWLTKAAAHQEPLACYQLGLIFQKGVGIDEYIAPAGMRKDDRRKEIMVKWFRRGADLCDAKSLYALGMSYLNGDGVRKDKHEAAAYLRLAGEQGHPVKDHRWIFNEKYAFKPKSRGYM
ncbi:uncharacterized protein BJ171DRAFT_277024 [Polychytrium aggregatum]|uniref:uncharacterized protein n=1 Tax=Polychytrium aggregatum TaxID=110093 RepID=UPI0022FED66E|nr:uncharacterized protein BJ171DRAFT_277024 [Polychytrium aggregatum]KAI9207523.1 hypothetical protein BJ171DRAFT_277024 [Polychytrium aggregatum]